MVMGLMVIVVVKETVTVGVSRLLMTEERRVPGSMIMPWACTVLEVSQSLRGGGGVWRNAGSGSIPA